MANFNKVRVKKLYMLSNTAGGNGKQRSVLVTASAEDLNALVGAATSGTNGLLLAGAYTDGAINVSAAQTTALGLDTAAISQHGTYSTALAYGTQSGSGNHLVLKCMHVTVAATGVYVFGDVNYIATSATSTGYIHVAYNYLSVGHNLANGYATRSRIAITASCTPGEQVSCLATLEISASTVIAAGSALRAGLFELNIGAGATVAQETHCIEVRPLIAANVAGVTSGIRININCSSANYVDYGLDIRSMSHNQTAAIRIFATPASAELKCGIHIEGQHSSTSVVTAAIKLAGRVLYLLDLSGLQAEGSTYVFDKISTASGDIVGNLMILDSDGSKAYINVYADQGDA
jgi:hypothetical protein